MLIIHSLHLPNGKMKDVIHDSEHDRKCIRRVKAYALTLGPPVDSLI